MKRILSIIFAIIIMALTLPAIVIQAYNNDSSVVLHQHESAVVTNTTNQTIFVARSSNYGYGHEIGYVISKADGSIKNYEALSDIDAFQLEPGEKIHIRNNKSEL